MASRKVAVVGDALQPDHPPVHGLLLHEVNAAAIVSGQLWAWGDAATPFFNPRRLGTFDGFTQVSLGDWHGLVIGADHRVYVWGGRGYSALADGLTSGRSQSPALLAD